MSVGPERIKLNRKIRYPVTDYERIFHPRTLAIVGVSAEEGGAGFGTGMLKSIMAMGFEGEIFRQPQRRQDFRHGNLQTH